MILFINSLQFLQNKLPKMGEYRSENIAISRPRKRDQDVKTKTSSSLISSNLSYSTQFLNYEFCSDFSLSFYHSIS